MRAATATLVYHITEPATIAVQVATAGATSQESLTATLDGTDLAVEPVEGLGDPLSGRTYLASGASGRLVVRYAMEQDHPPAVPAPTMSDRVMATRPSRYCPSDRLAGYAARFRGNDDLATVRRIVG